MVEDRRLLILGGTAEAARLAARAVELPGLDVTTSLAGRTRTPARIEGRVRSGGFGGARAMADTLGRDGFDMVVDATHPFAAAISAHGLEACAMADVPLLVLTRPAWRAVPGDDWIEVADLAAAADAVGKHGRRVFLTTGRRGLEPFAALDGHHFLIRVVDPPDPPLPVPGADIVTGRGPFGAADERALMERHRIDCVVAKNSGGDATYGKMEAARALGLPVVMVRRPDPPGGETVFALDEVLSWIKARLSQGVRS